MVLWLFFCLFVGSKLDSKAFASAGVQRESVSGIIYHGRKERTSGFWFWMGKG